MLSAACAQTKTMGPLTTELCVNTAKAEQLKTAHSQRCFLSTEASGKWRPDPLTLQPHAKLWLAMQPMRPTGPGQISKHKPPTTKLPARKMP